MIEIIITLIICTTIVVVTSAITKRPLTITVVHKEPAKPTEEETIESLIKQQKALDDYYDKNQDKVPTYDDVLAEINNMLRGEDVDG